MTRSNLPPQAYTSDTLAKAYEWLRSQPPGTASLAQDADSLVSLYLQSRRRTGHGVTVQTNPEESAPVSSQSFKADLKNLAQGLKQFEDFEPPKRELNSKPHPPAPPVQKSSPPPVAIPDSAIQLLIQEVKMRLNMQNDQEVLRMLVTLGYEQIRSILPKSSKY